MDISVPAEIDLAVVRGIGAFADRGGILRHVDLVGLRGAIARLRNLQQKYGERFKPPAELTPPCRRRGNLPRLPRWAAGGTARNNDGMTPPKRIPLVLAELKRLYPDAKTELDFRTPLQLMVAVMLSAQCTDKRVNIVTPALFKRFKIASDFANADRDELESFIRTTGFFRNKAKNIQAACAALIEHHDGEVPSTLEELTALPGLGRKSANCILGDAFDTPGITVDTHVGRLARRLGLTKETDPVKVEFALMKLLPREEWTHVSHRLILHGRRVCTALRPNCEVCTLNSLCPKVGVKLPDKKTVLKLRRTTP